jgi:cytoskeletal protein RodZ
MYRRAEVRAYADAVGLDRSVALARLDRALEQAMPPTASHVEASAPPSTVASGRTRVLMIAGLALTAGVIALALWARQPGGGDISSPAVPVSPETSNVASAPHVPNRALVGTSGSAVEPASPPLRQPLEPASLPPVSQTQPQVERSEGITVAPSLEPQLTVITEPIGARVTVNGVGWGLTPVTIRHVVPGAKRVRVTREGYRAEERLLQIEAGGSATTLRIPMRTQTDESGSVSDIAPAPETRADDGF